MGVRGTVVLYPGHGLNKKGRYGRPLMTIKNGKAIKVPGSAYPHPKDETAGYYREDFGTLAIAKFARCSLECMGYTVHLTREDNRNSAQHISEQIGSTAWQKKFWKEWKWVSHFCNTVDSDICVAIHTNAGGGTGITGFYITTRGADLARSIANTIHSRLPLRIRSVRRRNFTSLRNHSNGQACLIECAFHDNAKDLKLLLNPMNLNRLGDCIAWGIDSYMAETFQSP